VRRFAPGAGRGDRYRLLEAPARDPRLVMSAAGDAVVAWTASTDDGSILNACAYR